MGQRIAIVIGVGSSPQSQNTFLKPLTAPPHVARDLAAQLESPVCGFTVPADGLLVEETATAPAIRNRLLDATEELGADDLLLIAFCGHGIRMAFDSGVTDVVLATYDYHERRAKRDPEGYVTTRWLRDHILKSPNVGQIVLLLDCCYAGTINESTDDPKIAELRAELAHLLDIGKTDAPTQTRPGRTPITRLAISAALPRRTAGAKARSTLFSDALLKGLRGDPGALRADGTVTVASVREFIRQELGDQQMASQAGIDADVVVLATHASPVAQSAVQVHQTMIAEQASRDRLRIEAAANHVESTRLLQLRRQGFVGRVAEQAAIRKLIEQMRPTGGYVLAKGLAGEGKSSILATLIDEAGVTTTPHHFIALTAGRDYQLGLLRAVIAQLILKHDLPLSYFPEDSYPAMRDYFAVVLKQIAETGRAETIYLDGLDQLPVELDGRRDLSFLPPQPPPGIVIVLGTRPDDTLKPLEPLHRCDYQLPHLSLTDFQALLADRAPDRVLPAPTIEQLYQALDRNALYLALASDEFQRTPNADVSALVQAMTTNPGNLFQLTLDRLKGQDRLLWDRVIKPVLAVLVVTQEPLTPAMLRSILKVDYDDLREGLERLGGLVGQSTDGRVFLYHLKFRDFLQAPTDISTQGLFPVDEIKSWHQQLAIWCLPTQEAVITIWEDTIGVEQERHWYARHHALTHLTESQQWKRLWAIIDDGRYGVAKCRFDPSTHLYSLDLDRVRTVAADHGHLIRLWATSLLRVTLASRADQWPPALFKALIIFGQQAEVLRRTELLSDVYYKAAILCDIASMLPASEAHTIWKRAITTANAITNDYDRANVLNDLAQALTHGGHFAEARATADAITDDNHRASALSTLAQALTHGGHFAEARATADTITADDVRTSNLSILAQALTLAGHRDAAHQTFTAARITADAIADDDDRARALSTLATALTLAGHRDAAHQTFTAARTTADAITDNYIRVCVLSILAQALTVAGHRNVAYQTFTAAITTADAISNDFNQDIARRDLVQALAQAGHFAEARTAADAIATAEYCAHALSTLVQALAQAGHFAEARTTTDAITVDYVRVRAFSTLVQALAQAGHFAEARTTADAITDNNHRARALSSLTTALAQNGHFAEARATANAITNNNHRTSALSTLATALAQAGHRDSAYHTLATAITTANAISDDDIRARAFSTLAQALAQAGQRNNAHQTFTAARTTADAISDDDTRARALSTLAQALAQAGHFAEARATADAITAANVRPRALSALAQTFAQAGHFTEAHITTNAITAADDHTLSTLATALAQTGHRDTSHQTFTAARTTADAIADVDDRARALSTLATALAQAGHRDAAHQTFTAARITTDAISDNDARDNILSDLAQALAQAGHFAEARSTADTITRADARARALSALATILIQAGHRNVVYQTLATAITTADAISDNDARDNILSDLAQALAQAGHFAEARATADAITDDNHRASALSNLATALAQAGHFVEARATTDTITDDRSRDSALSTLAQALAQAGHFAEARATADAITEEKIRASTLSTLTIAVLATNDLHTACAIMLPLYQTMLLQAQTKPDIFGWQITIDSIGKGLAHGLADRSMGRRNAISGHLYFLQTLQHYDAITEAQSILVMAWQFATNRNTLLDRLPWITPWLAQDPTLLPAILAAFAWVDHQIAAMA